jgi:hypothetical protein
MSDEVHYCLFFPVREKYPLISQEVIPPASCLFFGQGKHPS